MKIDLQLHSTYSDGYLTPRELANLLKVNHVKIAALTDHHTVSGLAEFKQACQKYQIKVIPGIELYVRLNNRKFNLLWYNFIDDHPDLHKILLANQARRRTQVKHWLMKLKKRGFIMQIEKILNKYHYYIPLNHVIENIFSLTDNEKKLISQLGSLAHRIEEIIYFLYKSLRLTRPAECYIGLPIILKLRKKIGGQLILNHPGKHGQLDKNLIMTLKKMGLDGIEVISPHHSIGAIMHIQALAQQHKLITTGGSDFHRFEPGRVFLKSNFDYFTIESKYLKGIKKIIG